MKNKRNYLQVFYQIFHPEIKAMVIFKQALVEIEEYRPSDEILKL